MSGGGLARLVESGFTNAMTYDTYRPSYPAGSVQALLEKAKVADVARARIVEIGAGTGKLTEQLATGNMPYEIIAVEPHVHMRQVLDKKALPGVRILNGTAASLGAVEDAWADAVIVAQVSRGILTVKMEDTAHQWSGISLVC